jgi:hypothetical protein
MSLAPSTLYGGDVEISYFSSIYAISFEPGHEKTNIPRSLIWIHAVRYQYLYLLMGL